MFDVLAASSRYFFADAAVWRAIKRCSHHRAPFVHFAKPCFAACYICAAHPVTWLSLDIIYCKPHDLVVAILCLRFQALSDASESSS